MGSPISQVAPSTQPQGKGFAAPQPTANADVAGPSSVSGQAQGKGSPVTYPGQGGQPRMGQPNMYPNTVGQWDNASIQPVAQWSNASVQPQQSRNRGGKGKG